MHDSKIFHWTVVKHILCYLKSTINYGLFLSKNSDFNLYAHSDASWIGCPDDRGSTDDFYIFLSRHPTSWSSKKKHTVARSNIEANYKSLANITIELIWLQTLIKELFFLTAPCFMV